MDWSEYTESGSSELDEAVEELIRTNQEIEAIEAKLKELKAKRHTLQTKVLPDIMSQLGTTMVEHKSGVRLKLGEFVSGSLPKDPEARAKAFQVLESIGGGDLIKTDVHTIFGRGGHNEALSLAQELQQRGLPVQVEEKVHPQSLYAFIREKLREGEPVPAEDLGLYVGQIAKITKR